MMLQLFSIIWFLFLLGCANPGGFIQDSNLDLVAITDSNPASLQRDPFDLNAVAVLGDTIKLTISYSGGCAEHVFDLFMTPAAFMESNPVQANLFLRHQGNGDSCEAYITSEISFNLIPVSTLYQQMYGKKDQIILNVFEYFEDKPGAPLSQSYFPASN